MAVAVLDEAIGPSAEVSHVVAFYKSGSLRAISDVSCTPSGSTNTSGSACGQDFDCGGCTVMFAHGDALPMQGIDEWWRLASNDPKPECARFHAAYLLVDPADAASGGGASGDGTVPGNGGGDACDACLEACQGLSSCCTGTGCECEGACAPVGCVAGLTLCCGPGSCICTASCPY